LHNKIITKITRPQSSFAVSRERLFGLLDNLKNKKLIWLTGSPGAGKTTLASTYIAERNLSHIWYQLDETDEDIANFFEYLKLAIQQNMSKFCTLLPAYTPQYQAGLPSFIRLYAEAIAEHINSPALLVLDNYEKLTSSAKLHEVIRELSCCLPSEIFVLTLSRAEPPSAFARMQLHCDLAIIRGAELNMTQEEVNSFCESKQLQGDYMVDKNQAFYIFNQCQGWIAGFTFLLTWL